MERILVPRINTNDDAYVLQSYYVSEKQEVVKGSIIAALSSSKSSIDVTTEVAGIIHLVASESDEISIGDTLALVFINVEEFQKYIDGEKIEALNVNSAKKYNLTRLAKIYADENNFTEKELQSLNKKLIKKADLEGLVNKREKCKLNNQPLSQIQKSIAKTVTESHQNIPRAFLLVKVDCTKAQSRIIELNGEFNTFVGYGEVLTVILKEISADFPIFYSSIEDDERIVFHEEINIGITMDAGKGLFIPVVKSDQANSIEETTNVFLEYKMNAYCGEFKQEQLMGGTISISLNIDNDIVTVIPIILPSQVAMISIGGVMKELVFDEDSVDRILEKKYINLGIAYDHRVINGHEAMKFMGVIKQKLESFDVNVYRR